MIRIKKFFTGPALVLCALAVALLAAGCSVVPTYTPPGHEANTAAPSPAGSPPPSAVFPVDPAQPQAAPMAGGSGLDTISIGEKLIIVMSDTPPPGVPPHEVTVSSDGMISLPFNQNIKAAGKPKLQLQQEIRAIYVPAYFKQMSVTIRTEDRFFTVGGEVRNPSRQLYIGTMTVLKAIAAVGGFTEFADKRRVDIIRSNGQKEKIDAIKAQENPQQFDTPIYPGDQIYVHRRWI
jgi:protein involved in polysaccharide export with SLBB domain